MRNKYETFLAIVYNSAEPTGVHPVLTLPPSVDPDVTYA